MNNILETGGDDSLLLLMTSMKTLISTLLLEALRKVSRLSCLAFNTCLFNFLQSRQQLEPNQNDWRRISSVRQTQCGKWIVRALNQELLMRVMEVMLVCELNHSWRKYHLKIIALTKSWLLSLRHPRFPRRVLHSESRSKNGKRRHFTFCSSTLEVP